MRRLTIIVLCLAALYAGYWVIGTRSVDAALDRAEAVAQDQGWDIAYETRNTSGFPSRFDVTATDLQVTSPDGGFAYNAPFVQALALSYHPNQVIAVFSPRQMLRFGDQEIAVLSETMRARADFGANTSLDLRNLTAEAGAVALNGQNWQATADQVLVALRPVDSTKNTYATYVSLTEVQLPDLMGARLGTAALALDGTVMLDRPLDRLTAMEWMALPPVVTQLSVTRITLNIGAQRLTGAGDLTVDQAGIPSGQINLQITGWQEVLAILVQAGIIDAGRLPLMSGIIGMLAEPDGAVSMPLFFQNGQMLLGPVPLGPAPRLR